MSVIPPEGGPRVPPGSGTPPLPPLPPPGYTAPPPPSPAPPPGYTAPPAGYTTQPATPYPPGYPTAPPSGYPTAPPSSYPAAPGYPAPPATGYGLEFRPGVIPLRPLSLGDVYTSAAKTIRGNVAATMGLALLVSAIFLIPTTALGAWVSGQIDITALEDNPDDALGTVGILGQIIPTLGQLVATLVLTAFMTYVVGQAVLGRKVTAAETWAGAKGRLFGVVGVVLLTALRMMRFVGLIVVGPLVLLFTGLSSGDSSGGAVGLVVIAAIAAVLIYLWIGVRLAFGVPALVLERLGVVSSLKRSWRLTTGRQFWRILGIRLLTGLLVAIVAQIITTPLAFAGIGLSLASGAADDIFVWQTVITGVAGLISGAITTPFSSGVDSLMYVDQRIRREGLDVQLMQTAREGAEAPWPRAAG